MGVLPVLYAQAQFDNDLLTCDGETYGLLKNLSDSQLGKGKIYVFTTTHQDLAWLKHLNACIADRDTLWLTPFLKRLEEDATFKMDIEQTSIVMEYLHRHPETEPLFDKYIADGRILFALLLVGFAELVQGVVVKEVSLVAGGAVGMLAGVVTLACVAARVALSAGWFLPMFIAAFVAMMIVPGHVLNHKARPCR